jgi:SAM-dependent methyltransferase
MTVSFAEESDAVVGIDLSDRFAAAGTVLARERGVANVCFARTDGQALPFRDDAFDTVFSHAVIEHVADPLAYLREIRRVLKPGGWVFLQTAPYLAPSGAHLPRLKFPVPYYLFLGRRISFRLARWLAVHFPAALDAPPDGSSFLTSARRGEVKSDDLLYRVTVRNLRRNIAAAGFRVVNEDFAFAGLAKRVLPGRAVGRVAAAPLVRDILVTDMNYLLRAD